MRPKTTNTATQTATMARGKTKNCRTRNGVVCRGSSPGAGGSGASALGGGVSALNLGGPVPIAQAPQGQLDVDDQGLGGVLELVQAAVELVVVRLVGLVGLGQVLEAGRPLHEALQAGLTVGVHVGGLRPPQIQTAQESPDLPAAVFRPL